MSTSVGIIYKKNFHDTVCQYWLQLVESRFGYFRLCALHIFLSVSVVSSKLNSRHVLLEVKSYNLTRPVLGSNRSSKDKWSATNRLIHGTAFKIGKHVHRILKISSCFTLNTVRLH
jgi:hypothetical protein